MRWDLLERDVGGCCSRLRGSRVKPHAVDLVVDEDEQDQPCWRTSSSKLAREAEARFDCSNQPAAYALKLPKYRTGMQGSPVELLPPPESDGTCLQLPSALTSVSLRSALFEASLAMMSSSVHSVVITLLPISPTARPTPPQPTPASSTPPSPPPPTSPSQNSPRIPLPTAAVPSYASPSYFHAPAPHLCSKTAR